MAVRIRERVRAAQVCTCALLAALLPACRDKDKPAGQAAAKEAKVQAAQATSQPSRYADDHDRLRQLTERLNRAAGAHRVVVLGGASSAAGQATASIDYAAFDRLSDDGAAVLIAQAIVGSRQPAPKPGKQDNQPGHDLQSDELVGGCVARAGFGSSGFSEYLDAMFVLAPEARQRGIPREARLAAFMRGYRSASGTRPGR